MKILGIVLLLFSTSAFGGYLEESDVALGTIMRSHHFSDYDYNETHQGLYLSINNWSVGRYTNSYSRSSTVITHNMEWSRNKSFVIKSLLGAATGYQGQRFALGDVLPVIGMSAQYGYFRGVIIPDAVIFGIELPLN